MARKGESGGELLVMYVESHNVGRIIGRGGSRIKELQEESGARIQVAREEDDQGKTAVRLTGSQDEIKEAERMINEAIAPSEYKGRGGGGGGYAGGREDSRDGRGARGGGGGGGSYDNGPSETIYVESYQVGRIIGRGGSRIHEIQDESGCQIKVAREGGGSGMTPVDISGDQRAIENAKQLIRDCGVEVIENDVTTNDVVAAE